MEEIKHLGNQVTGGEGCVVAAAAAGTDEDEFCLTRNLPALGNSSHGSPDQCTKSSKRSASLHLAVSETDYSTKKCSSTVMKTDYIHHIMKHQPVVKLRRIQVKDNRQVLTRQTNDSSNEDQKEKNLETESVNDDYLTFEKNNNGSFICPICRKLFHVITAIHLHMRKEHPEETSSLPFHCPECSLTFLTHRSMKVHFNRKHRKKKPFKLRFVESLSHTCPECKKTLSSRRLMVLHFTRVHGSSKMPFECAVCSRRFMSELELSNHMGLRHKNDENDVKHVAQDESICSSSSESSAVKKSGKFRCTKCCSVFYNLTVFEKHFATIHRGSEISYKCGICLRAFVNISSFQRHFLITHGIVIAANQKTEDSTANVIHDKNVDCDFSCYHCNNVYSSIADLMVHQRDAHGNIRSGGDASKEVRTLTLVPNIAAYTPMNAKNASDKIHVQGQNTDRHDKRKTTGEQRHKTGQYICPVCKSRYSTLVRLTDHIREKHEDYQMPCKCDYCGKRFLKPSSVIRHIYYYKHFLPCPYHYDNCDCIFEFETDIQKHVKLMHSTEIPDRGGGSLHVSNNTEDQNQVEQPDSTNTSSISPDLAEVKDQLDIISCNENSAHLDATNLTDAPHTCPQKKLVSRNLLTKLLTTDYCVSTCPICRARLPSNSAMHMQEHFQMYHMTSVPKPRCQFCVKFFQSEDSALQHMQELHADKVLPFPCRHCSTNFVFLSSLASHLHEKHNYETMTESENNIFFNMFLAKPNGSSLCKICCPFCEDKLELFSHSHAVSHLSEVHNDLVKPIHRCMEHNRDFYMNSIFAQHQQEEHSWSDVDIIEAIRRNYKEHITNPERRDTIERTVALDYALYLNKSAFSFGCFCFCTICRYGKTMFWSLSEGLQHMYKVHSAVQPIWRSHFHIQLNSTKISDHCMSTDPKTTLNQWTIEDWDINSTVNIVNVPDDAQYSACESTVKIEDRESSLISHESPLTELQESNLSADVVPCTDEYPCNDEQQWTQNHFSSIASVADKSDMVRPALSDNEIFDDICNLHASVSSAAPQHDSESDSDDWKDLIPPILSHNSGLKHIKPSASIDLRQMNFFPVMFTRTCKLKTEEAPCLDNPIVIEPVKDEATSNSDCESC